MLTPVEEERIESGRAADEATPIPRCAFEENGAKAGGYSCREGRSLSESGKKPRRKWKVVGGSSKRRGRTPEVAPSHCSTVADTWSAGSRSHDCSPLHKSDSKVTPSRNAFFGNLTRSRLYNSLSALDHKDKLLSEFCADNDYNVKVSSFYCSDLETFSHRVE